MSEKECENDNNINLTIDMDIETNINGYTKNIDDILDRIRKNCIRMSKYHNKRYHSYKTSYIYHFRVPILILSSLNSFFSLGLQPYLSQVTISIITAVISLFCGLITSIELLLNIQKKLEIELNTHKEFYRLSITIYKELRLDKFDRGSEGKAFLSAKINEYEKLISNSNAVRMEEILYDDLTPLKLNAPKGIMAKPPTLMGYFFPDKDEEKRELEELKEIKQETKELEISKPEESSKIKRTLSAKNLSSENHKEIKEKESTENSEDNYKSDEEKDDTLNSRTIKKVNFPKKIVLDTTFDSDSDSNNTIIEDNNNNKKSFISNFFAID